MTTLRAAGCWPDCFTDAVLQLFPPTSAPEPDLAALYAHAPGLRLNMVMSVDGAVAVEQLSAGLSGPPDRTLFHLLRAEADVILVGAGTARAERYGPAQVTPERQDRRSGRGQARWPRIAVVSNDAGLPASHPLLDRAEDVLLITTSAGAQRAPRGVEVLVSGDAGVDLAAAVATLTARGLRRILCEGGPRLNGALHAAGLVDEVCVTTSPLLVGGTSPRLLMGAGQDAAALSLAHLLLAEDMLLARWTCRS